jgi:hypothetical protein
MEHCVQRHVLAASCVSSLAPYVQQATGKPAYGVCDERAPRLWRHASSSSSRRRRYSVVGMGGADDTAASYSNVRSDSASAAGGECAISASAMRFVLFAIDANFNACSMNRSPMTLNTTEKRASKTSSLLSAVSLVASKYNTTRAVAKMRMLPLKYRFRPVFASCDG